MVDFEVLPPGSTGYELDDQGCIPDSDQEIICSTSNPDQSLASPSLLSCRHPPLEEDSGGGGLFSRKKGGRRVEHVASSVLYQG
jgi:hypothetical protein